MIAERDLLLEMDARLGFTGGAQLVHEEGKHAPGLGRGDGDEEGEGGDEDRAVLGGEG